MPDGSVAAHETKGKPAALRACKSCSAPTVFDPASGGLKCPYCGAEKAIARSAVARHPIEEMAGISRPPDDDAQVLKCSRCGAQTTIAGNVAATQCAFCTAPMAPATNATVPPAEGVLPFRVTKDAAGERFAGWLKGLWFRPSNLKRLGRLREVRGIYVPHWAFDADAWSEWSAEAGYYYEVQRTEIVNGQEQVVTVREIRWEPAAGAHQEAYADLLESASRGLLPKTLTGIEPFTLDDGVTAFDGDFLAGFEAESHALTVDETWARAASRIGSMERTACSAQVPGDTQRNLQVATRTSNELVRSLLLPVYLAAYEYAGTVYHVAVNGQTGKVTGEAPWSVWKIASFTVAMAILIGAIVYFHQHR